MHNARVMSEANFKRVFGQLPPVPQRPSPETFDPDEIENKSLLKALDRLIEEAMNQQRPTDEQLDELTHICSGHERSP